MPRLPLIQPLNSSLSGSSEANAQLDFTFEQNPCKPTVALENAAAYVVATSLEQSEDTTMFNKLAAEHIWRSSDLATQKHVSIDTGFKDLNKQLSIGGWPIGATTEIGLNDNGIGELRLVLPGLSLLMNKPNGPLHTVWIAPPHQPFSPALAKHGIDLERLTIVRARTIGDILWAAEQALLSKACAGVFTWVGRHNLSQKAVRRLQLAAKKTSSWHVLFRHSEQLTQSSTSSLRLQLKNDNYSRLLIHITKQPQSWGGQECVLSLPPHYERWQRLPAQSLPHNNYCHTRSPRQVRILAKALQKISAQKAELNSRAPNNIVELKRVS